MFRKVMRAIKVSWNWICQRHRNAIIAASVFLLTVLNLILFVKFVLPAIVGIVLLIVIFFGEQITDILESRTPTPPMPCLTLENTDVCWEITNFMNAIITESFNILDAYCIRPETINDIFNPDFYITAYNNVPMLTLHLLRKQADISDEDCAYLKNVLQNKVNARFRDGYFFGYLWAVPAAYNVPLLKIVSVERTEMYLHFNILLTNTPASVQAARLSDRPTPPPRVDDIDPLF